MSDPLSEYEKAFEEYARFKAWSLTDYTQEILLLAQDKYAETIGSGVISGFSDHENMDGVEKLLVQQQLIGESRGLEFVRVQIANKLEALKMKVDELKPQTGDAA